MKKAPLNPVDLSPRPFAFNTMNVTFFRGARGSTKNSFFENLGPSVLEEGFSEDVFAALRSVLGDDVEDIRQYAESMIDFAKASSNLSAFEQMTFLQKNLIDYISGAMKDAAFSDGAGIRNHLHFNLRLKDGSWAHVYALGPKPYDETVN